MYIGGRFPRGHGDAQQGGSYTWCWKKYSYDRKIFFFWVDKIPETADCAFELPFISVDCLVLLQSVLVTKRLAADEASEARLAVNLLVFSQRHYRICPEITTLRPTSKLWPAIESHDINRMQKN